jgi:hypothetical protein
MSKFKELTFGATCDNCGKTFEDGHTGIALYIDEQGLKEPMQAQGWHVENDNHFCPKCHYFDEKDMLVIHAPISDIVANKIAEEKAVSWKEINPNYTGEKDYLSGVNDGVHLMKHFINKHRSIEEVKKNASNFSFETGV